MMTVARVSRRTQLGSALAILFVFAAIAAGGDTYWQHDPATPGDWFDPADWDNGLPTEEDSAYIDNGGTAEITVGNAKASNLYLGKSGDGNCTQTGGTHTLSGLRIADSESVTGTYELSGTGQLTVTGQEYVGGYGAGAFVHDGGTHAAWSLSLGSWTGTGSYVLSGSAELSAERARVDRGTFTQDGGMSTFSSYLCVGSYNGDGTYVQSAGRNVVTGGLYIGDDVSNTGPGTGVYELSGTGELEASLEDIGWSGHTPGLFKQTGGSNTADTVLVRSANRYEFSGGALQINKVMALDGDMDFLGSGVTLNVGDGATFYLSGGNVLNSSQASLVMGSDSLAIFPAGFDPQVQFKSYTTGGRTHVPGATLVVPAGVHNYLAGSFDDPVRCEGNLTAPQGTSLSLGGGVEVTATGIVDLGGGALTIGDGASGSIAGQLSTSGWVTVTGNGAMTQSGGVLNSWLTSVKDNAVFTQTAGQHIASKVLRIGDTTGSATYNLSGGDLRVAGEEGYVVVGYNNATGTFNQTGGTHAIEQGDLFVGGVPWGSLAGTGTYSIHAGELSVQGPPHTPGGFYAYGGSILLAGNGDASSGTLEVLGGTVRASRLIIGPANVPDEEVEINGTGILIMAGGQLLLSGIPGTSDTILAGGNIEGHGTIKAAGGLIRIGPSATVTASGGTLTIAAELAGSGSFEIEPGSGLSSRGQIHGPVLNEGTLSAYGGNLVVASIVLTNTGTLANEPGANLFIQAFTLDHTGNVTVNTGGVVSFDQPMTNSPGQTVALQGGGLSAPQVTNAAGATITGTGSITSDLTNQGAMDLFGGAHIFGSVENEAAGELGIRNGDLIITGPTTNAGMIRALNANLYFEGGLTNSGNVEIGTGTLGVTGDLVVGEGGVLTGDNGSEVQVLGDFDNSSLQGQAFDLSAATAKFSGPASMRQLEVAGQDFGLSMTGYENNFALGALVVDRDTSLRLADANDSQPGWMGAEALYVGTLSLKAGATIDLNGLNLYFLNGGSPKQLFHGDATLDGCVDGLDYTVWSNNYLTGDTWQEGDLTGDGIADGLDYIIWSNNYLAGCPGVPGAVPEPATLSLLAVGAVVLIRRSAR